MTITTYKRLSLVLSILCVGLIAATGYLCWCYGWLDIRVTWASEQTEIFDKMRTEALQSDALGAAGCLDYVVNYYPSGSKQETGSRLDRMVERERMLTERDIIAHLRAKTGEDLGTNAAAWIEKYVKR